MGTSITATQARANFYALLADVNAHHNPVTITGKNGNAILISEQEWNAITAALELPDVPGTVGHVKTGREEPVDPSTLEPLWI